MFGITKEVEKEIIDALLESGMIVPWQNVFAVVECTDFIYVDESSEEIYQNKIRTLNEFSMKKMKENGVFSKKNNFLSLMCCMTDRQTKEVQAVLHETYRKILTIMQDIDDQNEVIDDAILVTFGIVSYVKGELDTES